MSEDDYDFSFSNIYSEKKISKFQFKKWYLFFSNLLLMYGTLNYANRSCTAVCATVVKPEIQVTERKQVARSTLGPFCY